MSFIVVISISLHLRVGWSERDPIGPLEHVEHLRDRGDPRPGPAPHLGPRRVLAEAMDQDRVHAAPPRAGELVVRAVADEHRVSRLDTEQLATVEIDPGIRLREPDARRKDLGVEETLELRLGPQRLDVLAADGDQPNEVAATAQLAQSRD